MADEVAGRTAAHQPLDQHPVRKAHERLRDRQGPRNANRIPVPGRIWGGVRTERRSMVVLIADDDAVSRRALEATLTGWGYEVQVVSDGQQALESLLREDAPRLAVLDWMMPGMDGPEVCRTVRERSQGPYSWLLLLTARKKGSDLIAGLQAGADDYIRKPFDPGELKARLRVGERILALQAQLLEAQKALHVLATRDELTGLYNRRAVMERLDQELERAGRDGGNVCVLLMDVDHFKHLNDDRGHLAGDEVLHEIAARLER